MYLHQMTMKTMSSTAASASTTTTDSKSSAGNTSTNSTSGTYEVIPLDPNICFDPFRYRCASFREFENQGGQSLRKVVFSVYGIT